MEVTEVRVRLVTDSTQEKLRAFVTITLDNCFVVREVKIIEGDQGLFVAMPSRKAMDRCRQCSGRNVVQSSYCNHCGKSLPPHRPPKGRDGREKVYLDVAHPINSECRQMLHDAVLAAYEKELKENESRGRAGGGGGERPSRAPSEEDSASPSRSAQPAPEPAEADAGSDTEDDDAFEPAPDYVPAHSRGESEEGEDRFDKGIFA
jgi:stage V sporulation protein G